MRIRTRRIGGGAAVDLPLVPSEVGYAREGSAAGLAGRPHNPRADVRLASLVHVLVLAQRGGVREGLAAARVVAGVRLLTPVRALVGAAAGGLWLGGRQLQLCEAMDKEGAARAQEERQMAAKDKGPGRRNLHLARLGLQGGEAADSELSQAEREKREQAWKAKKEKLANPNFIVSATRLSVRCLPPAVTEAQLHAMALEAAGTAQKQIGRASCRERV